MLVHEALEQFVLQLSADGRSLHTIRQYRRHVRALARWAAEVGHSGDVEAFGHQDVARFLTSPHACQRPDGRAKRPTSANAIRTSMRVFFRYLHDAGLICTNPARLVRRARCGQPPPRGLSDADQQRLLEALAQAETAEEQRDRVLIELMLATGVRVGAAVAIDIEDVDFEQREILLRSCKGGVGQRVFLPARLVGRTHNLAQDRQGALFVGRGGRRITVRQVQRRLAMWRTRAGMGGSASCHALRHACAMRIYERTGDVLMVKAVLGHRSIASTMVYARPTEAAVRLDLAPEKWTPR